MRDIAAELKIPLAQATHDATLMRRVMQAERVTPRDLRLPVSDIPDATTARARREALARDMLTEGCTLAELADALSISYQGALTVAGRVGIAPRARQEQRARRTA